MRLLATFIDAPARRASIFAILASILAAADTILVKILAPHIHAFEIAFFRSWFGFLIVLPLLLAKRAKLASRALPKHGLRAALKYLAMVAFFVAVAHAPVADVTAISLLAPLLSILGAWLFLSEKRNPRHLTVVLMGLEGAAIIVRPGTPAFNPYLLFAVGGAVGLSSVLLLLKQLTEKDAPEAVLFWNLLLTAGISIGPALLVWSTPDLHHFFLLFLQGGLSAIGILMMAHAARLGAVGAIAGLDFLRLPIAAIMAFVLLDEPVQPAVWIGGIFILAAAMLLWFGKGGERL